MRSGIFKDFNFSFGQQTKRRTKKAPKLNFIFVLLLYLLTSFSTRNYWICIVLFSCCNIKQENREKNFNDCFLYFGSNIKGFTNSLQIFCYWSLRYLCLVLTCALSLPHMVSRDTVIPPTEDKASACLTSSPAIRWCIFSLCLPCQQLRPQPHLLWHHRLVSVGLALSLMLTCGATFAFLPRGHLASGQSCAVACRPSGRHRVDVGGVASQV